MDYTYASGIGGTWCRFPEDSSGRDRSIAAPLMPGDRRRAEPSAGDRNAIEPSRDTARESHAHARRATRTSYLPCGFNRGLFKYKLYAGARSASRDRLSPAIGRGGPSCVRESKRDPRSAIVRIIIAAKRDRRGAR